VELFSASNTIQIELMEYHCIIHYQNPFGKEMGRTRNMNDDMGAVNFVRSLGLNQRSSRYSFFKSGAECIVLLCIGLVLCFMGGIFVISTHSAQYRSH
jgi:hypothetical protein